MRAPSFDRNVIAGHAFARRHHLITAVSKITALEHQRRQRPIAQCSPGEIAEIRREYLLGRVEQDAPGDVFEHVWIKAAEPVEDHIDHHRATFDIDSTRSVNAVALDAEVKIVGLLFGHRIDGVEMGDEADGRRGAVLAGPADAGEDQMAAVLEAG